MHSNSLISLANSNISAIQYSSAIASYEQLQQKLSAFQKPLATLELIPLFSGETFSILASNSDLSNLHKTLIASTEVRAHTYLENVSLNALKAFYFLNKPVPSSSLLIIESEFLTTHFELICRADTQQLEILDHKNQRSFLKNTLYLSGDLKKLEEFHASQKNKMYKSCLIPKLNDSLLNLFGFVKP